MPVVLPLARSVVSSNRKCSSIFASDRAAPTSRPAYQPLCAQPMAGRHTNSVVASSLVRFIPCSSQSNPISSSHSTQVVTHLGAFLAHVLEPDELVDDECHGLVGQSATMLFEVAGDGLRQLPGGGGLAAE